MDMGANWIHGTNKNPIMHLAEKTKTVVMEPEEELALFDTQGRRRPDSEAVDLSGKMWEMVVDAFKYSDEHSADINPQTSLFEYFRAKLDQRPDLTPQKRDDLLQEAQMWGPFVGDSVETQSLKFFFLEECIEGENVFVAGTYKNILEEISRTAKDKEKMELRLQTEIVHFLSQEGEDQKVTITTSTGEQHSFNDVVITCPMGWLKRNHAKAFTPALPPCLSSAIESINYGRLEKLYVTFPSAFWVSEDDTATPDLSSHPIFTHFHDPAYVPHSKAEAWNQSVLSLAHLPDPVAHPTLLFYMYGACGTHLVNSIASLTPHSEPYNTILDAFARPYYSLLPHYSSSRASCTPTSFLMTTWQSDRFAGNGSYCNFQTGLLRGDEDIECLRDAGGLTSKGVWLAGEHTAPFIALGTTTGAWWSGEGVARRLCAKYGIEVDVETQEMELDGVVAGVNGDVSSLKKELDGEKMDGANLSALAI